MFYSIFPVSFYILHMINMAATSFKANN